MLKNAVCLPPLTICSWVKLFARLLWNSKWCLAAFATPKSHSSSRASNQVRNHPLSWHRGAENGLHISAAKLNNWRWSWVIDINPAVLIFPSWWAWITLQRWTYSTAHWNAADRVHILNVSLQQIYIGSACSRKRLFVVDVYERSASVLHGNKTYNWEADKFPNAFPVTHIFRIVVYWLLQAFGPSTACWWLWWHGL